MSDDAYRQVRGKVDVEFEDTGEQELKNIARPVKVYRALLGSTTAQVAPPALPDKPSIAVLPFQNISGDPEQDYFADGMVEDIITGLSRIKWLFVIARNSTFVYKGQAVDVKKSAASLACATCWKAACARPAISSASPGSSSMPKPAAHVWAERYDGTLDDIFELQDRITASVVGAIEPNLRRAEIDRAKRKRPDSLDAYDCYLRAFPLAYANTPDDAREALRLLDQALRLEPTYAAAHGLAAWCHEQLYYRAGFRDENKTAVLRHAAAAISHGGDNSTALMFAGFAISLTVGDHQAAINAVDRALALNPSYAAGYAFSAMVRALAGQYEAAIEHAQRAIRLNPLDPTGYPPYFAMTLAYLRLGRFEEALTAVANALQLNPKFANIHALHIVALIKLGRMDAARAAAGRLLELMPGYHAGCSPRCRWPTRIRRRSGRNDAQRRNSRVVTLWESDTG